MKHLREWAAQKGVTLTMNKEEARLLLHLIRAKSPEWIALRDTLEAEKNAAVALDTEDLKAALKEAFPGIPFEIDEGDWAGAAQSFSSPDGSIQCWANYPSGRFQARVCLVANGVQERADFDCESATELMSVIKEVLSHSDGKS